MGILRDKLGISYRRTGHDLYKGNLLTENESLLVAIQNNAIRTNYVEAKIDNMPQNSKCSLCGDRDETIIHIISKCTKLAQREWQFV